MREETEAGATTFQSLGMTSGSVGSNNTQKYCGLLEQSFFKVLRNELRQVFSYVYSVAPNLLMLHRIIEIFRILQFLGPSLCVTSQRLWSTNDYAHQTVGFISILFHIVPDQYNVVARIPVYIIYLVVEILFLAILFVSAKHFKKNASLPKLIPPLIAGFMASCGYLLPPIALEFVCEDISDMAHRNFLDVQRLVLMILVVIVTGIYLWIYIAISSGALMFRPDSMMTLVRQPTIMIFCLTLLTNMISGLCSSTVWLGEIIGDSVLALAFFLGIRTQFWFGGFIFHITSVAVLASSCTGGTFCVIAVILIALKKQATLLLLIVFAVLFIFYFFMWHVILNKLKLKNLILLDMLLDDTAEFERVKSINKLCSLCIDGFSVAHQVCVNWTLSRLATQAWPENAMAWVLFAKFVAIYPEETQTLAWIFHTLVNMEMKGRAVKSVMLQALFIARQRETNLSSELKQKLNQVSKHVGSAKHKLRHVWDMIIQGNVGEMERSTKRAFHDINKTDAEFSHLFRQFPNNRFVTRQYARFCKDMKGDIVAYAEMLEKTRLLQRGVSVSTDQAHELGLCAFPQLPDQVRTKKGTGVTPTEMNLTESISASVSEVVDDEEIQQDIDQTSNLRQRIETLVIPSTRYTTIIRFTMVLLLFVAPVIGMLIFTSSFIDQLTAPLQYMYVMSMLRTCNFQVGAFTARFVYEECDVFDPLLNTSIDLIYLGGEWDTKNLLLYMMEELTLQTQMIGDFRSFNVDDEHIVAAKSLMFDSVINYSFYESLNSVEYTMMSVQTALMDFVVQTSQIISKPPGSLQLSTINTSAVLNSLTNSAQIADEISAALTHMVDYIIQTDLGTQTTAIVLMVCCILGAIILWSVALVVQLKWIQSNKNEVYRCLTSLPKSTVSSLAEQLRVLKKETEESSTGNAEVNKQEENILKIFVTGGGSGSSAKVVDRALLIFGTIVVVILHIADTVLLATLIQSNSKRLKESAPHLDYLMGSYAWLLGAFYAVNSIVVSKNATTAIQAYDIETLFAEYDDRATKSRDYYHLARFGGPSIDEAPFVGFAEGLAYANEMAACPDRYVVPTSFYEASLCYSADLIMNLIEPALDTRLVQLRDGWISELEPKDDLFDTCWANLVFPIYDVFIAPMFNDVVITITKELRSKESSLFATVIVLMIVAILMELAVLYQTRAIDTHMRDVLCLLLHCPPAVVLQTGRIVKVLGGNFSSGRADGGNRDAEFYNDVVENLPDAIIVANVPELIIESANKSTLRIFGLESTEEVVGKKVQEFFTEEHFSSDISTIKSPTKSETVTVMYHSETVSEVALEISLLVLGTKYVYVVRDITQTVRYNSLIREEKAKSDSLLASILPANLVSRVQAGEKNISFAVQSATIVFMDIVSFTPWCGSLPADKVMATLNLMFKKFDGIAATYPTMTKIKCIGDCYMAAGGVFSEVNVPAEHSKEVVSFGLGAIDAIREINEELGEQLQIRVGVNTGGPIVAGVLGIGKPTFEILGPAINMAQQMEHHGVPMQVHISRAVYELIYGDTFVVKERGSIEVKGGSVITYLVSDRKGK